MAKVAVVGLKDDRERILSVLHDLHAVQIEPIGRAALEHLEPERASDLARTVGDELLRFRALKAALPATPPGPPRRFADLHEVLDTAGTVRIDAEVGELTREEDRLLTEAKGLDEEAGILERFGFYTDRLDFLNARSLLAFFGEADREAYDLLAREIPGLSDADFVAQRDGDRVRFLVAVRRAQAEAVSRLAQQNGVRLFAAPARAGTPAEALPTVRAERARVADRLAAIRARLAAIAADAYPLVAALEEALAIENRKLEVWTRLGASARAFALEGWVARHDRARLEATLAEATAGRAHLEPIATDEEPPTVMANPAGIRKYEFFIRFYSLPVASEWDPTWVFAISFPIFFGLMLGDIGYGLVILLVSLWMLAGFPGRTHLPRGLRNFVKLIMPPSAMRSLAYTLVPASLLGMGFGAVFNEFFGFHLLPVTVLDPISKSGLGELLVLSGYIGLGMVVLGFALGAVKEAAHRHYRGAAGKVGGILFAVGIAFLGLTLLRAGTIGAVLSRAAFATNPAIPLLYGGILGGFVLLMVGEGGQGLMALIEVVSHILSYTRIIGILLASVILALVIKTVAIGAFSSGLVGTVLGIVGLIAVNGFNIVLGVFEPGIQSARLIFVEHFSKYYGGNGRAFQPFGTDRTHTAAVYDGAAPARP